MNIVILENIAPWMIVLMLIVFLPPVLWEWLQEALKTQGMSAKALEEFCQKMLDERVAEESSK